MLFTSKLGLVLGLTGAAVAGLPSAEEMFPSTGGVILHHNAIDYFPHALSDISKWDLAVHYTGYGAEKEAWLQSLDPSTGADDREKAAILVAATYAKEFSEHDEDMVADRDALILAIKGQSVAPAKSLLDKRFTQYIVSHSHVVVWHACKAFFACVSGTTCQFTIDVGKAPRSKCQEQGGQSCCISWSTYKVQAGFFSRTWTNCDADVNNEHTDSASCEGKSDSTGGDVCLSNRADGCT